MKKRPLINYAPKEEIINTEWGMMKYEEWCKLEIIRRKEADPNFKGRLKYKSGLVCVV